MNTNDLPENFAISGRPLVDSLHLKRDSKLAASAPEYTVCLG